MKPFKTCRSLPRTTMSVIIPVYCGGNRFIRCLESISVMKSAFKQIIVVADGDGDGTWRTAEKMGFKVIKLPKNKGPAHARNMGAMAATGDILVFIDADVTVSANSIETIPALFEKNPDLCALFGAYDDAPFEKNLCSRYRNLLHHFVHMTGNKEASTFWAGCGAVLRPVFHEIGGFDDKTYPMPCIEDIELGYRLKKSGYRIGLFKQLQVKHLKKWTFFSMMHTDFFCRALPWSRLIVREKQMINDLNLKTSARASAACTQLLLATILLSVIWPWTMAAAPVFGACLVALNLPLYRFFKREHGLVFMIACMFLHGCYYLISSIAFGWIWGFRKAAQLRP